MAYSRHSTLPRFACIAGARLLVTAWLLALIATRAAAHEVIEPPRPMEVVDGSWPAGPYHFSYAP